MLKHWQPSDMEQASQQDIDLKQQLSEASCVPSPSILLIFS